MRNPDYHLAGKTHLKVIGCNPVGNPRVSDYAWNDDFTAYRVCPLLWWDDASYIAYQSDDFGDDEDTGEVSTRTSEPLSPVEDDGLPF